MSVVVRHVAYPPLFDARFRVRLFFCCRESKPLHWTYGPVPLSAGKMGFSVAEAGTFWAVVNGRRFTCRTGELLVLRPGDVSTYGQAGDEQVRRIGLGIECDEGDVTNILLRRAFRRTYRLRDPAEFVARFDRLLAALSAAQSVRDWAVGGALMQLVELILRETAPQVRSESVLEAGAARVQQAQEWADENLHHPFRMTEWARTAGIDPTRFYLAFKTSTGLSPKHWLQERRLQSASHCLISTGMSVKQIGREVGLDDAFYFSKLFRKRFGCSPSQWRKMQAAGLRSGKGP
jgi:AraC-like DNA-binding protein